MLPLNERLQESRVVSTDEIRAAFPALERRHEGFPVAYFDGPGGTQVPRAVGGPSRRESLWAIAQGHD